MFDRNLFFNKIIGKRFDYLIIIFLAFIVMWNLLLPGYILTLDMIFPPDVSKSAKEFFYGFHEGFYNSAPIVFTIYILSFAFPIWFIQKIILLGILIVSGISAYKVCPSSRIGKIFAAIFYMINPYTYVRFLAGHWHLLLAYAIFPLAFKAMINFFSNFEDKRKAIEFSLWLTLLGIFSTHYLFMFFFVFVIFFVFELAFNKKRFFEQKTLIIKNLFVIFIIFFFISFYWISQIFTTETILTQIEEKDIALFSSKPSLDFNVAFNVASLHGFWRGGYDYAKYHIPFWYVIFIFILFLSVYGFVESKEKQKYHLAFIGIFSFIIAVSSAINYFSYLYNFLFENLLFFKGLREPHKFVGILAFVYSYFGGIGVGNLKIHKNEKISKAFQIAMLILPLIYSYTMLFGFNNWLKTIDYPKDWYEVNDFLNSDKEDFKVLFLPWHLYMDFKWIENSDKRIANPAPSFFNKTIISGDNIEAGGIYSQSPNKISKYIELLISEHEKIKNIGKLLSPLNIKYIILTKEVDWNNYFWLKEQEDLEIIKETENFIIFLNKYPIANVYLAKDLKILENLSDIIETSKKEDILKYVYILKDGFNEKEEKIGKDYEEKENKFEDISIEFHKKSETEIDVKINFSEISEEKISKEDVRYYLVLAEKYSPFWRLLSSEGKEPFEEHIANIGLTNAFLIKDSNKSFPCIISYNKPQFYLFSLIFFVLVLIFYFSSSKKQKSPTKTFYMPKGINKIKGTILL
jgi:hypothetical protein